MEHALTHVVKASKIIGFPQRVFELSQSKLSFFKTLLTYSVGLSSDLLQLETLQQTSNRKRSARIRKEATRHFVEPKLNGTMCNVKSWAPVALACEGKLNSLQ